MSNNLLYFWINGELKTYPNVGIAEVPEEYRGAYCVDSGCQTKGTRYGHYTSDDDWIAIEFENFPAEFKLILLTLGVT